MVMKHFTRYYRFKQKIGYISHIQESEDDVVYWSNIFWESIQNTPMSVFLKELDFGVENTVDHVVMNSLTYLHELWNINSE